MCLWNQFTLIDLQHILWMAYMDLKWGDLRIPSLEMACCCPI